MARTLLLIDGDQYLHRACAAVERDTRWDDENHVLSSNEVEAWEVVEGSIKKLCKHFGVGAEPIITLSEGLSGSFRRLLVDPTYKMHRKADRKPLCFPDLKDKLKAEYKCVYFDGLEADDVMGILATKPGPDHRIVISRDKDLRGIPGKLWTGTEFLNISAADADYWHLYQTLVGDASDGYKGCPGIGPKKAEAILGAAPVCVDGHDLCNTGCDRGRCPYCFTPPWPRVVEAFIKAGLTEADALRQARLARILRWSDWDSEKKEPILWTP